ncbi:hypothetical protein AOQ84DRAFT_420836 [Glonium stellatum]|uniref:Rhodopsin domain-containing protein n=1 Tax=Glonium stellatum TaxID=574774 RepID=A0A8E2JWE5_9PEZI|nr:hypothetical protein AOQ84DRAFT_420836 [Glonium stellatum]
MKENVGFVTVIVGLTLSSFSTIVVALRFYCRYFLIGAFAIHDYVMLGALFVTWGNTILNYYQYYFGSGVRFSSLKETNPASVRAKLAGTLLTWYLYRFMYVINLFLVKLSILLFYRSIVTQVNFRRAIHATIAFVSLYSGAMVIATIFQCQRPSDAYSVKVFLGQFRGKFFGKCYNPNLAWFVQAGVNLFTDAVIIILPIPCLLALRIQLDRRLALVGIFSVGIVAIIASCIRVGILAIWSKSAGNQSQYGAQLLLWGQVEVNSGIVSASIPFLRPLFKRTFGSHKQEELGPPLRSQVPNTNKALELSSMEILSGPHNEPDGTPVWNPFITVPESLSSTRSSIH